MKIALIKPPATYTTWYKRPILGIAYISSVLENHGYQTKIIDAYFYPMSDNDIIQYLVQYKPDLVGITAMTHEINNAHSITLAVKKKIDVPVVIGGCHATARPKETMEEFPAFDFCVYGEGEYKMLDLVKYVEGRDKNGLEKLNGIVYRDEEDNIVVNPPREPIIDLDSLPFPNLQDYYRDSNALAHKNSCYVMFTTRGCPFNCIFCMRILGKKVRRRSAANVIDEIKRAIDMYGAHTIDFADEIFLFNNQSTRELLERMILEKLPIRWSGLTKANFVSPELINLAKRAGCYRLEMGVESGNDEMLKTIRKGITVKQVAEAVKIIKNAGVFLGTYYILGHPNESRKTVKDTINLAAKLNTDTIAVGIMVPYPGTKIFEMAKKKEGGYGLNSLNWSVYDKYGGSALKFKNFSLKELKIWQIIAYLYFYIRNFRILDIVRFLWHKALPAMLRIYLKKD